MASPQLSAPMKLSETSEKARRPETRASAARLGQIPPGLAGRGQNSAQAKTSAQPAQAELPPPPPPEELDAKSQSSTHSKQRSLRKRSHSFTEGNFKSSSGGATTSKRWRQRYKKSGSISVSSNNNYYNRRRVLRSKFLLGGNIRDPLNLNGLGDTNTSKTTTPESSPMPTPKHRKPEYKVEVLIPPNIADPLNLQQEVDENEFQAQLISPKFRGAKRKRKRMTNNNKVVNKIDLDKEEEEKIDEEEASDKDEEEIKDKEIVEKEVENEKAIVKENESESSEPNTKNLLVEATSVKEEKSNKVEVETESKSVKKDVENTVKKSDDQLKKSSSTEINQKSGSKTSAQVANSNARPNRRRWSNRKGSKYTRPSFREKNKRYEYGNYDRYYGYRIPSGGCDARLRYLRPEWFEQRDVLDIGCNVGTITCAVAQHFRPKLVVGMDIDKSLIEKAKKNAKMLASRKANSGGEATDFPINLPLIFGPLDPLADIRPPPIEDEDAKPTTSSGPTPSSNAGPATSSAAGVPATSSGAGPGTSAGAGVPDPFPHNVRFVCSNYVLESDDLLEMAQPEFDVILCLSTTKWMHLNFGDEGLKRAFKRMYAQLRPGGMLVLEAQPFSSYSKRKTLTERIYENYSKIKLKPEHFADYLLHEVGFGSSQTMAIPTISPQGFHRPIQVFVKRLKTSSWQTPSSRYATPYPDAYPLPHPPPICYAPSLTPNYQQKSTPYSPYYCYHTPSYLPSLEANDDSFPKPVRRPSDYTTTPVCSPQCTDNSIQQAEVSGNTTPHPGPSEGDVGNPTYLWYGNSSGNNTPRNEDNSNVPSPCTNANENVASPQTSDP